jgi:hypothetical protein
MITRKRKADQSFSLDTAAEGASLRGDALGALGRRVGLEPGHWNSQLDSECVRFGTASGSRGSQGKIKPPRVSGCVAIGSGFASDSSFRSLSIVVSPQITCSTTMLGARKGAAVVDISEPRDAVSTFGKQFGAV